MKKGDNPPSTREDDSEGKLKFFRTGDRFARVDNQFWFSTREGEEGPFRTREEAEKALQRYIASKQFGARQERAPEIEQRVVQGDPTIWDRQIDII